MEKAGPDMEQRDPQELNSHIKVQFDEIFGEPNNVRSIDCVWRNSFVLFNGTLHCCYKFLTLLCALPMACCWGIEFACLACTSIWCYTPYIRALSIQAFYCRRVFTLCLEACLGPCCETLSMCLKGIKSVS